MASPWTALTALHRLASRDWAFGKGAFNTTGLFLSPMEARAFQLDVAHKDWHPYVVLGVAETLGYIVRGVTGFGSAIVVVSVWTICNVAGIETGPFASLIFADSICSLATAAPLVYLTKPWRFANCRLVVTLLAFQAVGAPVGAYLVQHLDPQRLQFAIATALLFLFLLMATPLSKWIRRARLQRARSLRRGGSVLQRGTSLKGTKSGLWQPLLPRASDDGHPVPSSFWQRQRRRWAAWRQRRRTVYSRLPDDEEAGKAAAASSDTAAALDTAAKAHPAPAALFTPFAVPAQQQQRAPVDMGPETKSTMGDQATGGAQLDSGGHFDRASSFRGGASPRAVKLLLPHGSLNRNIDGASPGPLEVLEEEEASGKVGSTQGRGAGSEALGGSAAPSQQPSSYGMILGKQEAPANGLKVFSRGSELCAAEAEVQGLASVREEGTAAGSTGSSAQSIDSDECISTADIECGRLDSVQSAMLRLESIGSRPDQAQALLPVTHAPTGSAPGRQPDDSSVVLATRTASQKAAEWMLDTRVLVSVGAVAATCSGMLSALSGVGGPPLILMYELLAVPKEVVRATTTVTNIFSVKFLTYLALGAGSFHEMPFYGVAIVAALIGLNAGNALAARLDQRAFGKVLLGVMLLSTCLLYAASFGLTAR